MSELVNKELLASLVDAEELYQNAPCGYFSFLPDGTIIKINRTLLKLIGCTEEEVLHRKKFTDLISKGGIIYYEMFYLSTLKMQGQINEINYDIVRNDGSCFPALMNSVAVKDEKGGLRAINATIFDITDRKKYENELLLAKRLAEAEKKRFEFLSDLIPEIIWTASADGAIDYVNQRFYAYFELVAKKLEPDKIISKVHPDDRRKAFRTWVISIKGGIDFQTQVRLQNKFGQFEWHLLRAMAYRSAEGQVLKWFGSCTNIDEHMVALQRKDEFIHIASHELKTPVTSLKAYNQLLMRTECSDLVKSFVQKSATTLSNLHFLISSLLDVSLINAGQLSISLVPVSITDVLKHSVESIRLNYPSHQIVQDFDPADEIIVNSDKQRITQVLINLLSNAVKYSPQADKIVLSARKSADGRFLRIEVTDFGFGIPPEKVDMIFDKYYRVTDTKNNNRVSGLGLGLYIIQNIVKLHGSRIYVKSKVNEGSSFYFTLPVVQQADL